MNAAIPSLRFHLKDSSQLQFQLFLWNLRVFFFLVHPVVKIKSQSESQFSMDREMQNLDSLNDICLANLASIQDCWKIMFCVFFCSKQNYVIMFQLSLLLVFTMPTLRRQEVATSLLIHHEYSKKRRACGQWFKPAGSKSRSSSSTA